jgi:hypothetical protein
VRLCDCGCGRPAAIAKSTDRSRGYVSGQPTRYALGHGPDRRGSRPSSKPGFKVCVNCDLEKPEAAFPIDPQRSDRLHPYCKRCKAERMRAANKRYRQRHPDRARRRDRAWHLRKHYGITVTLYEELLASQDGRCAICGTQDPAMAQGASSGRSLAVDHDHETGAIRGLLCMPCNLGLGYLRDDPNNLRRAAQYLESAQARSSDGSATTASTTSPA